MKRVFLLGILLSFFNNGFAESLDKDRVSEFFVEHYNSGLAKDTTGALLSTVFSALICGTSYGAENYLGLTIAILNTALGIYDVVKAIKERNGKKQYIEDFKRNPNYRSHYLSYNRIYALADTASIIGKVTLSLLILFLENKRGFFSKKPNLCDGIYIFIAFLLPALNVGKKLYMNWKDSKSTNLPIKTVTSDKREKKITLAKQKTINFFKGKKSKQKKR